MKPNKGNIRLCNIFHHCSCNNRIRILCRALSSLLKGTAARVGKIISVDGHIVRHITKKSVNSGFDKYLMNLAKSNGGTIEYNPYTIVRYGTIEAISNTMYGTTKKEFYEYVDKYIFYEYVIGQTIIDNIFID